MRNLISIAIILIANLAFGQGNFDESIKKHRKNYLKEFLANDRAPLKDEEALSFLRFYDPNKKFKITANFEQTPDAKPFEIPTFSGINKSYIQHGWLVFQIDDVEHKLAVYQNVKLRVVPQFREQLFLPFKDKTNAKGSYGGGRYIDLKKTDIKNGKVILDFNKAYNPWCAYSDGYSCPIPPKENHLKIEIQAGEKEYGKSKY